MSHFDIRGGEPYLPLDELNPSGFLPVGNSISAAASSRSWSALLTSLSRYKRDIRKAEKRDKDMRKLKAVYFFMNEQAPSPTSYKDQPLRGAWKGRRDLHIEPDWLLLRGIEGA